MLTAFTSELWVFSDFFFLINLLPLKSEIRQTYFLFWKQLRYSFFYIMNFFLFYLLPNFLKKSKLVHFLVWEVYLYCKVCLLIFRVINTVSSEHKQIQIFGKVVPFWKLVMACSERFEVSWLREVLLWWSYSSPHVVAMGKRAPSKCFFVRK